MQFISLLLLTGFLLNAQDRQYIVPKIGKGTVLDPIRPKYTDGKIFTALDLGDSALVTTTADLSANPDVFTFPINLDQAVKVADAQKEPKLLNKTTYQEALTDIRQKGIDDQKKIVK